MDKDYPCKNWNFLYTTCNRKIKSNTIFPIILSENDFDLECKGKSNIVKCCWFVYSAESIMDFKRRLKRYG